MKRTEPCEHPLKSGSNSRLDSMAFFSLLAATATITFSIVLGELFLGISLVLWIWRLIVTRQKIKCPPWGWVALGFVILCFVTALAGPESKGWGKSPRLLWFLALPAVFTMAINPRRIDQFIRALCLGCTVLALQILIQNPWVAMHQQGEFWAQLIDIGSMTDGQMLMVGMMLTAGLYFQNRELKPAKAWLWLIPFFVQLLAMVINFKRGSWISVTIILGIFLLINARRSVVYGAIAACVLIIMLPPVRTRLSGLATEFNTQRGGRMTMWCKIAPALIKDHPWGIGYGTMTHRLLKETAPEVEPNRNHLHSNPVQILVETGWLGLALYLAWMVWVLCRTVIILPRMVTPVYTMALLSVFLALCGLILNGLVEYNFGDTELIIVYGVLMGLIASCEHQAGRPSPDKVH